MDVFSAFVIGRERGQTRSETLRLLEITDAQYERYQRSWESIQAVWEERETA